eukprot:399418-Alexandrium_andersonii.AAC.1
MCIRDSHLAAPAEPQAAAAAAAPARQDVLQDLSREFVEVTGPASGDGVPTVQAAARLTTWRGPDPRAESALQRVGVRAKVPIDWVGPEETELFHPLPPTERNL